ncbi:MAG: HU family DNA-binding protein [Bryobacteraceae bacterium]
MNKNDLARRLARESHRSRAQAADELDALLHSIFKDLKRSRATAARNRGAAPEMTARTGDDPRRGQ